MDNPTQKFRQGSIVFDKPGILSQKLKTLTSSKYLIFFCWNLHMFPTYQCVQKGVQDLFHFV